MKWLNPFFYALAFFTRIPVPWLHPSEEDWKKSVAWFPAVGLVIGFVLWGALEAGLALFSSSLAAVLALIAWVCVTGGLHLDGWMDLADGLGSNRPREQALAIMKDSRVGAMGVWAAILLLLLKAVALLELAGKGQGMMLLVVPMAARTHLLLSIRCWPYLSPERGMGRGLRDRLTTRSIAVGYAGLLISSWLLGGRPLLAAALVSLLAAWWISRFVSSRLGGLNGDCYGAVIEGSEAVMLLVLAGSWWT